MLDIIAGLVTSLAVCISAVNIYCIKRFTGTLSSAHGVAAAIIFILSLWTWYICTITSGVLYGAIGFSIALSIIGIINARMASIRSKELSLPVDRRTQERRKNVIDINEERRSKERRRSHSMRYTKLKTGRNI